MDRWVHYIAHKEETRNVDGRMTLKLLLEIVNWTKVAFTNHEMNLLILQKLRIS